MQPSKTGGIEYDASGTRGGAGPHCLHDRTSSWRVGGGPAGAYREYYHRRERQCCQCVALVISPRSCQAVPVKAAHDSSSSCSHPVLRRWPEPVTVAAAGKSSMQVVASVRFRGDQPLLVRDAWCVVLGGQLRRVRGAWKRPATKRDGLDRSTDHGTASLCSQHHSRPLDRHETRVTSESIKEGGIYERTRSNREELRRPTAAGEGSRLQFLQVRFSQRLRLALVLASL